MRFYAPRSGEIRVDGYENREVTMKDGSVLTISRRLIREVTGSAEDNAPSEN
jgi:hypothetical protein